MSELVLKSATFENGGSIPRLHTCDGRNVSPQLSWTGVPEKTASLAVIVEDPDAPRKTWVHWVLFDLPPTATGLPEGVPPLATLEGSGVHGTNDFGSLGYGGPCPPSGTHNYVFTLYALDQRLNLPARSTRDEVVAAMQGHILSQGRLTGRYSRGGPTAN
jgi:Raf kinase inhibitor-like YbhB/YbcL family protein